MSSKTSDTSREKPLHYSDYLQLNSLLSTQNLKSVEAGQPAHDEMLFIIVHQTYELWFKQILFELDSIMALFSSHQVDEQSVSVAVSRIERIVLIQKLLIDQINIIETMTPLDFMDFRNLLVPSSGFQSIQFRSIENKLGLRPQERVLFGDKANGGEGDGRTSQVDRSLFSLVEEWLERTPFLHFEGFSFLTAYQKAVEEMLQRDEEIIRKNPSLSPDGLKNQLEFLKATRTSFQALFDPAFHQKLLESGQKRLSYQATHAALLIVLYRDHPILHMPYQFIRALTDMDELLTTWRSRHALMARRMIGTKIGSGGSSGHDYLRMTAEKHRVFADFSDLSTFLVPRSSLPKLPTPIVKNLGFYYSEKVRAK